MSDLQISSQQAAPAQGVPALAPVVNYAPPNPQHEFGGPKVGHVANTKMRQAETNAPSVDEVELRARLDEAIKALNDQMKNNGRGLKFSIDEAINRHIITVSNTLTGEVVRQIPTEVAVSVAHSIEDIKGLLADETV